MRISRGVNPLPFVLLIGLVWGCVQTSRSPAPEASSIEAAAYAACQLRDREAADLIDALAAEVESGSVKYDGPLQDRLLAINEKSANNVEAQKLIRLLAAKIQPGNRFDSGVAAKALREYAAGRRRAGQ